MISYIITFAAGALLGFLFCDIMIAKLRDEEEFADVEERFIITIEMHDCVYYAYSESSLFLGQSTSLVELAHSLLGEHTKIHLTSDDPIVLSELAQLALKLESYRIVHESNQEH
jgi:hypothetical protein